MSLSSSIEKKDDISIVICGAAGQGIQTVEHFLTRVIKSAGFDVFAMKEYMSRVRGGLNSTEIRVSSKFATAFIDRIDILIPLNNKAINHLYNRIDENTIIIGEKENIQNYKNLPTDKIFEISFTQMAIKIGGKVYSNIISAGLISELLNVDFEIIKEYITRAFQKKGNEVIENNIKAIKKGMEIASTLKGSSGIKITIQKDSSVCKHILLDGTEAVAMGAIAGGCNYICAYPMSPSTGVLTFLAQNTTDFDIIVEQAEDEISAINSCIGSWYAGGRGLVSTSGGGLALMSEGLSLAGASESPVVIHLAQRVGPATGLPTRTAQGDLNLALYSGHGFFPKIILAPGKLDDAFYLTQKAFDLADKFQVPVFILTDQYFVDSCYNVPPFDVSKLKITHHYIQTENDYKRYKFTETGISPRGIPKFGKGLVCVDGHTHDEEGHISEDLDNIRIKMVEKRLKKMELMKKEAIPPEILGNDGAKIVVIGWGSTFQAIKEALVLINSDEITFLHFKQVYPLPNNTADLLRMGRKRIIFENNVTSQFARLLKVETGIEVEYQIRKYNGLPFSVEEIHAKLVEIMDDIGGI
ncbi:MAG: 2-oxoacid:acceptor oxidoreductase subunit alpha [Candidatus Helarchaeota archaeon]